MLDGRLWLEPRDVEESHVPLHLTLCLASFPQYLRQEQEEEGRKRYEAQKLERMETKWRNGDIVQPVLNPGERAKVEG